MFTLHVLEGFGSEDTSNTTETLNIGAANILWLYSTCRTKAK